MITKRFDRACTAPVLRPARSLRARRPCIAPPAPGTSGLSVTAFLILLRGDYLSV
jgi:hypothetical protein